MSVIEPDLILFICFNVFRFFKFMLFLIGLDLCAFVVAIIA